MEVVISALPGTVLAGIALKKKALTAPGTILAWSLCLLITYTGGAAAFTILAVTFLLTILADRYAGRRADPGMVRRKSGTRDATRVFCNVGTGAAAILFMLISGKRFWFTVYAAVMAETFADSLASKIGPLSNNEPIDICTLKRVSRGLSGGITLAGSLMEFAGAFIIALIYLLFEVLTPQPALHQSAMAAGIILFSGFAGAMFDSVLGSKLQVKYICPICGRITEREMHCGITTAHLSGSRAINNDTVNLISNLFTFLLSALLLRPI